MPKSCRAPRCPNAAGRARPSARRLSFYRFPLQDAARLRQWLRQMRREHWVPTRHQHLCSDHFEPSCFQYRWGVRYLRPDAVPTIFPGSPPVSPLPEEPGAGPSGEPPALPPSPAPLRHHEDLRSWGPGASLQSPPSPRTPPGPPSPRLPPPRRAARSRRPQDSHQLSPNPQRWSRGAARGGVPAAACSEPTPPEPVLSSSLALPGVPAVPSAADLAGVVLALQRKLKVLQQRHRRHRARLGAMEGLLERLRREGLGESRGESRGESLVPEERLQLACLQPEPALPDPGDTVTIICQEEEEEEVALPCAVPPPAATACGLSLEQP